MRDFTAGGDLRQEKVDASEEDAEKKMVRTRRSSA